MTVNELINILQTLPPNALVVTEGYEMGYEPIKKVEIIKVTESQGAEWWDGKYEKSDNPDTQQVVFINAETKNPNK